ncbi:transporter substrate-binding domain-containing protein [Brucella pituitosa]|uniref:transporter substrate-binding domain-containing protein n=1 Tax=Brucella pituitosa TaxID=571256 RepID=UPI0009A24A88|nr:transporter substrate-binding domain-containing protein [Brucella pituitosa]
MKKYFCSIAIFLLTSFGTNTEAADRDRLDDIISHGILKVGTTGDYKPFTFIDPTTEQFTGFDIDMARELAKALGVRVEFVQTTWPTLTRDFGNGKFDIAMGGISITLERQKTGLFSTPYLLDGKAPIARCPDRKKYATLTEIDKPAVKVIVNPGGTNEKFLHAHIRQAQIDIWGDNTTIFDQIARGNADVMITDASEARYQQHVYSGVLCAINPDKPFNSIEKAYWVQRAPHLTAFVNQWLAQSKRNGSYDAIYQKWFK